MGAGIVREASGGEVLWVGGGERVGGVGYVCGEEAGVRRCVLQRGCAVLRGRGCVGVFVEGVEEAERGVIEGVGFAVWEGYRDVWRRV